jgi:hypothetical protein
MAGGQPFINNFFIGGPPGGFVASQTSSSQSKNAPVSQPPIFPVAKKGVFTGKRNTGGPKTTESESEVTIMNDSDASEMTTNWDKFKKVVSVNKNASQSSS